MRQWKREMKLKIVQLMKGVEIKMEKIEIERKEKRRTRNMNMNNFAIHAPRVPVRVLRVG